MRDILPKSLAACWEVKKDGIQPLVRINPLLTFGMRKRKNNAVFPHLCTSPTERVASWTPLAGTDSIRGGLTVPSRDFVLRSQVDSQS